MLTDPNPDDPLVPEIAHVSPNYRRDCVSQSIDELEADQIYNSSIRHDRLTRLTEHDTSPLPGSGPESELHSCLFQDRMSLY